jgi:hypothetical protein
MNESYQCLEAAFVSQLLHVCFRRAEKILVLWLCLVAPLPFLSSAKQKNNRTMTVPRSAVDAPKEDGAGAEACSGVDAKMSNSS